MVTFLIQGKKGKQRYEDDFCYNKRLKRAETDYKQLAKTIHAKLRLNMVDIINPTTKIVNLTPQSPQKPPNANRPSANRNDISEINNNNDINDITEKNDNDYDITTTNENDGSNNNFNDEDIQEDEDVDEDIQEDEEIWNARDRVGEEFDQGTALADDEEIAQDEYEQRITELAQQQYDNSLQVLNALMHENLRAFNNTSVPDAVAIGTIGISSPPIASPVLNSTTVPTTSRLVSDMYASVSCSNRTTRNNVNATEVATLPEFASVPDVTGVLF